MQTTASTNCNEKKYTIFIGCLPGATKKKDIINTFLTFGQIHDLKLNKKSKKGGKGYGTFEVKTKQVYDQIVNTHHKILDRKIVCRPNFTGQEKWAYLEALNQRRVFIKKIPSKLSDESLFEFFSDFGEVERAYAVRSNKGRSYGFGYVNFYDLKIAEALIEKGFVYIKNKRIICLPFDKNEIGKNSGILDINQNLQSEVDCPNAKKIKQNKRFEDIQSKHDLEKGANRRNSQPNPVSCSKDSGSSYQDVRESSTKQDFNFENFINSNNNSSRELKGKNTLAILRNQQPSSYYYHASNKFAHINENHQLQGKQRMRRRSTGKFIQPPRIPNLACRIPNLEWDKSTNLFSSTIIKERASVNLNHYEGNLVLHGRVCNQTFRSPRF